MVRRIQGLMVLVIVGLFCLSVNVTAATAQVQPYRSSGGLTGQFQQVSPRTPAFDISARGEFGFDPNNFANSNFQFVLAGADQHQSLGDIVAIRSVRYVGNQGGALVFEVAFEGAGGGRTTLTPIQASLVLENPQSIPAGQAPASMQLRLRANTHTVQFDLPILLHR